MPYPENLPDTANVGEDTHVQDHNKLATAVGNIDSRLNSAEISVSSLNTNAQLKSQKGVANGYASLDGSAKVPTNQIPSLPYQLSSEKGSVNGYASLDGTGKVPSSQIPTLSSYQATSEKGVANGYASLDGTAKVPLAQIPSIPTTPVLVKGVATWATISGLVSPAQGDLYVLQAAAAGAPLRVDGSAAQEGDAIVRTNSSTWINSGPFQGPQGPAGQNASGGGAYLGNWTPGAGYAVGDVVSYENRLWIATAIDPNAGWKIGTELAHSSSLEVINSSQATAFSVPAGLSLYPGMALVAVVQGQAATISQFTATGMTEITALANAITVSGGQQLGTRVFYSADGALTGKLINPNGTATYAVHWIVLYGTTGVPQNATPTSSTQFSFRLGNLTDINFGGSEPSRYHVIGSAIAYKASGELGQLSLNSYSYLGTNAHLRPAGQPFVSKRISTWRGVALEGAVSPSKVRSGPWRLALSGGLNAKDLANFATLFGGLVVFPANTTINNNKGGVPYFDKTKWKPLGELYPRALTAGAATIAADRLVLEKENRSYDVILSDDTVAEQIVFSLSLPVPEDISLPALISLRLRIKDRRRYVGSQLTTYPQGPYDPGSSATPLQRGGRVVEPNQEVGADSTIIYSWEPSTRHWLVEDYSPTAWVRSHYLLSSTAQESGGLGIQVYVSPEATSGQVSDLVNLINAIPIDVRQIMATEGLMLDAGNNRGDTMSWRTPIQLYDASPVTGVADQAALTAVGAMQAADGAGVVIHEFGHFVDYKWGEYLGRYAFKHGTKYTDALTYYQNTYLAQGAGNLNGGAGLYLTPTPLANIWLDAVAADTNNIMWSYVKNDPGEWVPQVCWAVWKSLSQAPGNITGVKNQVVGNNPSSATLWNRIITEFTNLALI